MSASPESVPSFRLQMPGPGKACNTPSSKSSCWVCRPARVGILFFFACLWLIASGVSLISAARAESPTSTVIAKPVAAGAVQTPVVVVPGILGSLSSCLFVDPASGKACPASYDFHYFFSLATVHLTPEWILNPIGSTYDSMVTELENNGILVYPAPYDWRNQNSITAGGTLSDITARARSESGADKVDIVAHSMGGLVTRSYIEQLGMSDVGKFIMLGTPNRGSQDAYYVWEGGDLSVFGTLEGSVFVNPLIQDMKVGYGRGQMSTCKFIQKKILSVRELLPIDNYLVRRSLKVVDVNSMYWRNNLIPSLDYARLIGTLGLDNIRIFAGSGVATTKSIKVTRGSTSRS